jgi:hypothetical protein
MFSLPRWLDVYPVWRCLLLVERENADASGEVFRVCPWVLQGSVVVLRDFDAQ